MMTSNKMYPFNKHLDSTTLPQQPRKLNIISSAPVTMAMIEIVLLEIFEIFPTFSSSSVLAKLFGRRLDDASFAKLIKESGSIKTQIATPNITAPKTKHIMLIKTRKNLANFVMKSPHILTDSVSTEL